MFASYNSFSLPYSSASKHGICSCSLGPLPAKQHQYSQHRAVRWVMNDYSRYSSVSNLLHNLNWQPLQVHCKKLARLQIFYKAVHNSMALSIPHFLSTSYPTRNHHQYHYIIQYMNQLLSKLFLSKEWNQLPTNIIEANNLQSFSLHPIDHIV